MMSHSVYVSVKTDSHTHMKRSSDSLRTRTSRRRWMRAISTSISSGDMVLSAMDTSEWPETQKRRGFWNRDSFFHLKQGYRVITESAYLLYLKNSCMWFQTANPQSAFPSFLTFISWKLCQDISHSALFMWRVFSHSRESEVFSKSSECQTNTRLKKQTSSNNFISQQSE